MKNLVVVFLLLELTSYVAYGQTDQTIDLEPVITSINKSLSIAQRDLKNHGIVLFSGSVTLEVSKEKSVGGKLKLFVKAGAKWERGNSATITYNYEYPIQLDKQGIVEDKLADLIVAAGQTYKSSSSITGLQKASFETVLSVWISKSASGGIDFELFGLGAETSGDYNKKVFHKIKLKFI